MASNNHGKANEMEDLGRARFDHDTAAIGDRDDSFHTHGYAVPWPSEL